MPANRFTIDLDGPELTREQVVEIQTDLLAHARSVVFPAYFPEGNFDRNDCRPTHHQHQGGGATGVSCSFCMNNLADDNQI